MLFDASAFVGPWPFGDGRGETLRALTGALAGVGVAGAALSPVRAVLAPEPMGANRALLAALARRPGGPFRALPVPILDPSLPDWRAQLAECRARGGAAVRAVKIVPNYHGYALTLPAVGELAAELARVGLALCVQVRMVDERARHPLMRVPGVAIAEVAGLAAAQSELPVLVCGAYLAELAALAPVGNAHAELSFVESGYLLRDALGRLGADRLLLGTHAPLHYPAVGVAKLDADELEPAARERLGAGNFRRLFGLEGAV